MSEFSWYSVNGNHWNITSFDDGPVAIIFSSEDDAEAITDFLNERYADVDGDAG